MDSELKITFLVVDQDQAVVNALIPTLRKNGYKALRAMVLSEVLDSIKKTRVDAILLGPKTEFSPGTLPFQKIRELYPQLQFIMLVSSQDALVAAEAVKKGAHDFMIVYPYDEEYATRFLKKTSDFLRALQVEARYKTIIQESVDKKTREYNEAITKAKISNREMVQRLLAAAEFRDDDTGNHVKRIGMYATVLSAALRLETGFNETIAVASSMHDLGKIGIPDAVLLKPSGLTPQEFEIMKKHTTMGHQILAGSDNHYLKMAAEIALSHHERFDGTGYPQGLKGDAIPYAARIVNLCDQYDALRSKRPYKNPFDHATVYKIITEGDGRTKPEHFDPVVLNSFIKAAQVFDKVFETNNQDGRPPRSVI
jgi:putative two-component system response regulator